MSYYLFLDDNRSPSDVVWIELPKVDWVIIRNYNQFTTYIQEHGVPIYIAFDHDLSIDDYLDPDTFEPEMIRKERDGLDCTKWLINYCIERRFQFPKHAVHSMNVIGRENIKGIISSFSRVFPELCLNI